MRRETKKTTTVIKITGPSAAIALCRRDHHRKGKTAPTQALDTTPRSGSPRDVGSGGEGPTSACAATPARQQLSICSFCQIKHIRVSGYSGSGRSCRSPRSFPATRPLLPSPPMPANACLLPRSLDATLLSCPVQAALRSNMLVPSTSVIGPCCRRYGRGPVGGEPVSAGGGIATIGSRQTYLIRLSFTAKLNSPHNTANGLALPSRKGYRRWGRVRRAPS